MTASSIAFAVVAALVVAAIAHVLSEPGPIPALVILRRYGAWPAVWALAGIAAAAWLVWSPSSPLYVALAGWSLTAVAIWRAWGPRTAWRAIRRCVIRLRWPSAARSSGLSTTGDRRSAEWPGGAVVTLNSDRVEHLPSIAHGRALPNGRGVSYRLRPARGGRIADIEDQAEALAGALAVRRVLVERFTPHRGQLVVLWRDELEQPHEPAHNAQDAP